MRVGTAKAQPSPIHLVVLCPRISSGTTSDITRSAQWRPAFVLSSTAETAPNRVRTCKTTQRGSWEDLVSMSGLHAPGGQVLRADQPQPPLYPRRITSFCRPGLGAHGPRLCARSLLVDQPVTASLLVELRRVCPRSGVAMSQVTPGDERSTLELRPSMRPVGRGALQAPDAKGCEREYQGG
jgi:hypothetical protein